MSELKGRSGAEVTGIRLGSRLTFPILIFPTPTNGLFYKRLASLRNPSELENWEDHRAFWPYPPFTPVSVMICAVLKKFWCTDLGV